jgi:hypothetical protein
MPVCPTVNHPNPPNFRTKLSDPSTNFASYGGVWAIAGRVWARANGGRSRGRSGDAELSD